MSERKVRVRFAPSPTGPLHMGGVRTALYNYLFAKKHGGDFLLRIEDTDQGRFVPGAEAYIIEALSWCGIQPNEGIGFGDGPHAPYRQSERKAGYRKYAEGLVEKGFAYYAFDTTEELDEMRKRIEASGGTSSYNAITRQTMRNSLSLPEDETKARIAAGDEYVIRIKIPRNEEIRIEDLIRGWVVVHTSQLDDKVLFKSDGMPTYHLANVVDDHLMEITHVIRGEEWLPSAPLHLLLYRYLGWEGTMPRFAHLPLLLRPDGNGKLSKRDGDRLGFPVFPLNWKDPSTGELSSGYREKGYFPEAFINMLALLGWHTSGNREIFSLEEMVKEFSLERVSKSGAKFDPEKAKWFNQHYLRERAGEELERLFRKFLTDSLNSNKIEVEASEKDKIQELVNKTGFLAEVIRLLKEKACFVEDFWENGKFLFLEPKRYDEGVMAKKWNEKTRAFVVELGQRLNLSADFTATGTEAIFKQTCADLGIKSGEVMQLFRVCLTGEPGGPALFEMCALLGKDEVNFRLEFALKTLDK